MRLCSKVSNKTDFFRFTNNQMMQWGSKIGIHKYDLHDWLLRIMETLRKHLWWETKLFLTNGVLTDSLDSILLRKMVMEVEQGL